MAHHTREFWERVVAEVSPARGLTLEVVAARHQVRPKTLAWWRWSLAREGRRRGPLPRLLPVVISPGSRTRERARVEVDVANGRLHVDVGVDPAYVAALARALRM